MATLIDVFNQTGGPDPDAAVTPELGPSAAFLQNFSTAQFTGANGSGPILNANANLIPTRADQYRDSSSFNDFRLGNGLGVSRAFRKPDSQPGQVDGGFYGNPVPNKMFGRSDVSHDLNFNRDLNQERADMSLKKMGFKPNELPKGGGIKQWVWQDHNTIGVGGPGGNQYNRNYGLPDADAVYRRMYQPAPSRLTQMLGVDVEEAALRPNRTMHHPMKVVSEDKTRDQWHRIPRNTDVAEHVIYEKIVPRGFGPGNGQEAPRIYGDTSILRQPVGTNETGDRSVLDRWGNPSHHTDPLAVSTLEDNLTRYRDDQRFVRGHDLEKEMAQYRQAEDYLNSRGVFDPNMVQPQPGEFPRNQQGINGPLVAYPSSGKII